MWFPVLFIKRITYTPCSFYLNISPKHIMLPEHRWDSRVQTHFIYNIGIVCWFVHPKLSVICGPNIINNWWFEYILVAPDLKFNICCVFEAMVVAFTMKVYVAAPVLAETMISCSWQNVLEASLVDKLMSVKRAC